MAAGTGLIRLAVFGQPVAHSLSPRIHAAFAAQLGLSVDYRAIEPGPEGFAAAVRSFAAGGARGCNITLPYKPQAYTLAKFASPRARLAQASNVLSFDLPDAWRADNTDGAGLVSDLSRLQADGIRSKRVLLLGAGGAAAGVLGALLESKPGELVVANRTSRRAASLVEAHRPHCLPGSTVRATDLRQLAAERPFDLLVNTTSMGHAGQVPELPSGLLTAAGLCYDINYGEAAKPFALWCQSSRRRFADGLGMLVEQAALSFEIWTGKLPESEPVLRALRAELQPPH